MAKLNVARKDDYVRKPDKKRPGTIKTYSENVFVNSLNVAFESSLITPHDHKVEKVKMGSSTVYVNGHQIARKDDPCTNGCLIDTYSDNVFAGG